MPVIDGEFTPRHPLTVAERNVDYLGHDQEIVQRRQITERHALPAVKRLAYQLATAHSIPLTVQDDLARRVRESLGLTMTFGYKHARAEITRIRETNIALARVTDAGQHGHVAAGGLDAIRALIRRRAQDAADAVARAAAAEAVRQRGQDAILATAAIAKEGVRVLHNQILDLVGETLNLGRTAGALSFATPPEFALRSEQLDKDCCDPCIRLHGTIAEVGSDAYYALLPPADCLGGGRCRGIMVFGEEPAHVELSEAA